MQVLARYLLVNSLVIGQFICFSVHAQTIRVIDNKGTLNDIESSKWTLQGTHIFNKNSGNVGIGSNLAPTSTLHVFGDVQVAGGILDSSGDIGTAGQILSSTSTGTNWVSSTSSVGWVLTGNSATDPSTNFLGTTDATDLVLRTNNTEKLRVFSLANSSFGLGRNSLATVNGSAATFSGPTLFLGEAGNVSSSSGIDFIIDDDNNATNTQFRFKANGDGNTGTTELLQINETGHVGIGLAGSTAQATLHTSGTVRFENLGNTTNTNLLTTDANGNVSKIPPPASDGSVLVWNAANSNWEAGTFQTITIKTITRTRFAIEAEANVNVNGGILLTPLSDNPIFNETGATISNDRISGLEGNIRFNIQLSLRSSSNRTNLVCNFFVNDVLNKRMAGPFYARNSSGHDQTGGNFIFEIENVVTTDEFAFTLAREANNGTVELVSSLPDFSYIFIEKFSDVEIVTKVD